MTLDYKILWIDDRKEFFEIHREFIIDYLEEKGFDANIIEYKSFDEFTQKETDVAHQKTYDLFLIDLNLDHGNTGDQIIKEVRENVLTDIIFYSTNLQDVRKKVNENNIEGIYTTSRNQYDFEEKVTDVIDVTIKKVQDVNNLRGLIMAEVAELDRIKTNIVHNYCKKTDGSDNDLKKYVATKIFNDFNENIKQYSFLQNTEEKEYENMILSDFINDLLFLSDKKARTINKINIKQKTGLNFNVEDYRKNILTKRNVLAHEKEYEDENGKYLTYPNGERLNFTEDHCIQIRKDIKRYKELLENIEHKINLI